MNKLTFSQTYNTTSLSDCIKKIGGKVLCVATRGVRADCAAGVTGARALLPTMQGGRDAPRCRRLFQKHGTARAPVGGSMSVGFIDCGQFLVWVRQRWSVLPYSKTPHRSRELQPVHRGGRGANDD